ncbi:MAG TPA: DUF1559 domain-containing protein, partial [Gemmataceae bacterium]|nr:DUF1559 domain-containing protein [Gemmataceae bacterium]
AEARARTVAPFLDAQTVGVAHVDLTRVDADALFGWVAEVGRLRANDVEGPRQELRARVAGLTRAGARELYVVVSLADLPNEPPLVVVPLTAGTDAKALTRELGRVPAFKHLRWEALGQALVGGGADALKRLRGAKPAERPELAKAFTAAGDTAAQVLVLPPPDTRRVLDELLPTLPPQVGGDSTRPLTHGVLWAALGVDLPPKPSVRLTIQSPDADSARALKNLLARLLKRIGGLPEAHGLLPDSDRLAEVFTPQVEGDRLTLSVGEKELRAFLPNLVKRVYGEAERRAATNKLRQMVIAMHNYADTYRGRGPARFPAVATFDKQGKPLLSWRVSLLPFVGENDLYKQFHLDEPWDSPHNRQLIARMPAVYQGPNMKLNREGKTIYLLPVGKDVAFKGGPEGPRMPADFQDGTSNTILIVEADDAHAVPWTKPEDLKVDLAHPERGLGGHFHEGFLVALADGSVRLVSGKISKATLRAAFTPAGGEVLGSDW